ncbi:MAG: hypothetical protein ACR2RE_24405, partial [Geminicoccaceae bacterium]
MSSWCPATIFGFLLLGWLSAPAVAQDYFEKKLRPGSFVPKVRAIACNQAAQLEGILEAYSVSYRDGKAAFEKSFQAREFDVAAGQIAPVCDEMWFHGIIPVRTLSEEPYKVWFANGSVHRRYIIEAVPVGPDGVAAEASYY